MILTSTLSVGNRDFIERFVAFEHFFVIFFLPILRLLCGQVHDPPRLDLKKHLESCSVHTLRKVQLEPI